MKQRLKEPQTEITATVMPQTTQIWCSHHVDHMPTILVVGNNFWQTENMNTEYCTDLNSNTLRYRKQKISVTNEDYALN